MHPSTPQISAGSAESDLIIQSRVSGLVGERARSALIQQHYPWISARCRQFLGNEADVADAAQEVALKIYRHLDSFEGRSTLRTWIGSIAARECLTILRAEQRRVQLAHLEKVIALHESSSRETALLAADSRADQVDDALAALKPLSRKVLRLRFYSDLTLEEISAVLGISLSAAKMRLYRALDQFKMAYDVSGGHQ